MNAVAQQQKKKTEPDEWDEMMERYKATGSVELRNQLVIHYGYIANTVAAQMYGLSSNYAQIEDVVNEGILAIIDCLEKFNPERGASFKSYAFKRVQGAVIDFVRKQDWFPRRVRVNARNIMDAHDALRNELMREPTDREIAGRLGMPLESYQKNTYEAANSLIFSFEGVIENMTFSGDQQGLTASSSASPENTLMQKELMEMLKDAIDSLSPRERLVITLYYYERLKLSSIAKVMGVTDQRVSQISSRAVMKLRQQMQQYLKGGS